MYCTRIPGSVLRPIPTMRTTRHCLYQISLTGIKADMAYTDAVSVNKGKQPFETVFL